MSHAFYPSGNPRFNHVAMSVPAELLDEIGRKKLTHFFAEVLGFDELPTMTVDRKRLILSCVHWDQFIFLIAEDEPMRCPKMDHYGFAVGSLDDLRAIRDRAITFRDVHPELELIDLRADDQKAVVIHSIYLRYLLPMTCEIQWWEFPEEQTAAT